MAGEARRGDRVPGVEAACVVFAVPGAQLIIGGGDDGLAKVFRESVTSLTGSGHMKRPDAKNQCRRQVYTGEKKGRWEESHEMRTTPGPNNVVEPPL